MNNGGTLAAVILRMGGVREPLTSFLVFAGFTGHRWTRPAPACEWTSGSSKLRKTRWWAAAGVKVDSAACSPWGSGVIRHWCRSLSLCRFAWPVFIHTRL